MNGLSNRDKALAFLLLLSAFMVWWMWAIYMLTTWNLRELRNR